ncbi:MAG: (d)CMP kinase [Buchnera aphidicola (Periphyllus aceris)]|nr:(d)CMP kinase [Buchnera aphidicola (Periphyllus aceris)]
MKKKPPVITIDGPSGVGKSTISYAISKKLNWNILESGYLYRIIAHYILKNKIPIYEKNIVPILKNIKFNFEYSDKIIKVYYKEKDISQEVCSEEISMLSSKISIFPYIRYWLLSKQKEFRKFPGLIANGRDMGTIVFSDAILKIFLTTSIYERSKRRYLELKSKGFKINFNTLIKKIKKRDKRDKNRIICPLKPDKNAIIIDSTNMSFTQTLQYILKNIKKKIQNI